MRSCPALADVDRADRLYEKIRSGKTGAPLFKKITPGAVFLTIALLGAAGLFAICQSALAELLFAVALIAYIAWMHLPKRAMMNSVTQLMGSTFTDNLAAESYVDDDLALE